MQWTSRLIAVPTGSSTIEQTLARERRKVFADRYMLPLMGVLFWTLLLAIALFVVGFLVQLWDLALSFDGRAPILVVGGVFATGLSLLILSIIIITTFHATIRDHSPFESPLSSALRPLLRWIRQHRRFGNHNLSTKPKQTYKNVGSRNGWDHDHVVNGCNEESVESLIRWDDSDSKDVQALKSYARLVLSTNDLEILERAVLSFEFGKWHLGGDALFPVFKAVWDRFMGTDTSYRVKETTQRQLVNFKGWSGWRNRRGEWRFDLTESDLTRWCKKRCEALTGISRASRREFFSSWVFFTSLEEDNHDLRAYEPDAYDECVAHILNSYHRNGVIGNRLDLFRSAVKECNLLLEEDNVVALLAILASVDRAFLLRSLIRNPDLPWYVVKHLASFVTKGEELDTLNEMSHFLSNLPTMNLLSTLDGPQLLVMEFLHHLISGLPLNFIVSAELDLSPILTLCMRQSQIWQYSATLIYYLDHDGLVHLLDWHPAYMLWKSYASMAWDHDRLVWKETSLAEFCRQYQPCFVCESPYSYPLSLTNTHSSSSKSVR